MGSMNHWFQKKNIKQNKIVQSSDMLQKPRKAGLFWVYSSGDKILPSVKQAVRLILMAGKIAKLQLLLVHAILPVQINFILLLLWRFLLD
jgi:hypothetical protein